MKPIKAFLFWLKFWIITILLFSCLCVTKVIYFLIGGKDFDRITHNFATAWAKLIFLTTPGWEVSIIGAEKLPNDRGFVLVSNHESMADIWALYNLGIQFRWLSKASVFKVPCVGPAMKWAGYVPIDRGNRASHLQALEASAEWLKKDVPMLYFPEGTRSKTGELLPFKIGAFKLALDENVPIIAMAVKGTRKLIPKGSASPSRAHVKISIIGEIRRGDAENLEDYASRTRDLVMNELKKIGERTYSSQQPTTTTLARESQ